VADDEVAAQMEQIKEVCPEARRIRCRIRTEEEEADAGDELQAGVQKMVKVYVA